tara:strand:+ start:616 stop:813 length:198 start_codon:yes stop_codon:yes gene_type:complete
MFALHFSTLAQTPLIFYFVLSLWRRKALFVNENRYENDSHSGFFLETKKIPPFGEIPRFLGNISF